MFNGRFEVLSRLLKQHEKGFHRTRPSLFFLSFCSSSSSKLSLFFGLSVPVSICLNKNSSSTSLSLSSTNRFLVRPFARFIDHISLGTSFPCSFFPGFSPPNCSRNRVSPSMAANKFATMLHRNTNKITLVLVYTLLEWILIVLLLLNSLFSYLIIKFANFFGLKTPCLWCSRVDHIFEPGEDKDAHRDLLCEAHAGEVSKLGYCTNHRKLAESQSMCEDCSSSRPDCDEASSSFRFFPWMKNIGMVQSSGDGVIEKDEEILLCCSCCGVTLNNKACSPYIVIKPSWNVLDYIHKKSLVTGVDEDYHVGEGDSSDQFRSDSATDRSDVQQGTNLDTEIEMLFDVSGGFGLRQLGREDDAPVYVSKPSSEEDGGSEDKPEKVGTEAPCEEEDNSGLLVEDPSSDQTNAQMSCRGDVSLGTAPQHLDFVLDWSGHLLLPAESKSKDKGKVEDPQKKGHQGLILGSVRSNSSERERMQFVHQSREAHEFAVLESMEIEETDNSLVFHPKGINFCNKSGLNQLTKTPSMDSAIQHIPIAEGENGDSDVPPETSPGATGETESEVSIGTEIPDLDRTDDMELQETISSSALVEDNPCTSHVSLLVGDYCDSIELQEETLEFRIFSVPTGENTAISRQSLSFSERDEITEQDRDAGTHSSVENPMKLTPREKEDCRIEENLDGDVTVEELKETLGAERKALQALYAELEEERSASAVAANQTMAMINRLQEEKAAMQMEALQFQRMMEEQSEYDQEALQLLNELMVKREREKQELEKELEVYKKKVLDYEGREKMRSLRGRDDQSCRTRNSSPHCSNADDSEELYIDLNREPREDGCIDSHQLSGNHSTPVVAVLNLEESLADYEDERLSILEELKVLEDKLKALSDGEDFEHLQETNGDCYSSLDKVPEYNGNGNGYHREVNRQHNPRRGTVCSNGKRLLPLFDAISSDNESETMSNGTPNGCGNYHSNGFHEPHLTELELEERKLSIEEEVDHLYERVQAFEADRDFLKHLVSSLKKGDSGVYLLQEILQHLRDLRDVELRVRNLNECH